MQKDFWRELFRPENKKRKNGIFLALLLGVMLLVLGGGIFPAAREEKETALPKAEETIEQAGRETERRMAEILSKIEGAGQVDVMLTYSAAKESHVAQEEKTEESRSSENGKNSESVKREVAVVLKEDGKGNQTPVILTEISPQVEGVVIVAEGGGDAVVCNALNSAAQALLNVPAHKIAVLKMK